MTRNIAVSVMQSFTVKAIELGLNDILFYV